MAVRPSIGLRAVLLSAMRDALSDAEIRIYSGAVPANSTEAIGSATLLCTVKRNGNAPLIFTENEPAVMSKPTEDVWTGDNINSSVATFYRLVNSEDDDAFSEDAVRLQGTVGVVGADLNLDTTLFTAGVPTPVRSYLVTVLAGTN